MIRALHICWAGLDLPLEEWRVSPQTITRQPLGHLTAATARRSQAFVEGFDVVLLEIPAAPFQEPFFAHRHPLKNLRDLPRTIRLAARYAMLLAFVSRQNLPFVIFDFQDSAAIAARFLPLLRRAVAYHKRELPRFPASVFLHTEHFAIEPWRNRGRYAAEILKLRPLSLGALCPPLSASMAEKDIDILWSGSVDNSPVRERGVRLLRELSGEGFRVRLLETPVSRTEFHAMVGHSWLTFCPDGNGWQCYRSFEAAMLGSIPVMTFPTIWQDQPFRADEHCFYYDPDGDDLKAVVRRALADRARLTAMRAAVQQKIATFDTEAAVYHRHLATVQKTAL